jgi:hypothetical protein
MEGGTWSAELVAESQILDFNPAQIGCPEETIRDMRFATDVSRRSMRRTYSRGLILRLLMRYDRSRLEVPAIEYSSPYLRYSLNINTLYVRLP